MVELQSAVFEPANGIGDQFSLFLAKATRPQKRHRQSNAIAVTGKYKIQLDKFCQASEDHLT